MFRQCYEIWPGDAPAGAEVREAAQILVVCQPALGSGTTPPSVLRSLPKVLALPNDHIPRFANKTRLSTLMPRMKKITTTLLALPIINHNRRQARGVGLNSERSGYREMACSRPAMLVARRAKRTRVALNQGQKVVKAAFNAVYWRENPALVLAALLGGKDAVWSDVNDTKRPSNSKHLSDARNEPPLTLGTHLQHMYTFTSSYEASSHSPWHLSTTIWAFTDRDLQDPSITHRDSPLPGRTHLISGA
ncbi:hypothetical protein QC763_108284 [Podospora pseudopauciseta]|uniref:Uncharacterized protein n=1 Tax=Podospora pseudopauciseta TaxID=2093780 RepID=A0ABR0HYN9_9PEZI|nr:hypothetical protein QC763_108284 [Podospora pseudopauciseta]